MTFQDIIPRPFDRVRRISRLGFLTFRRIAYVGLCAMTAASFAQQATAATYDFSAQISTIDRFGDQSQFSSLYPGLGAGSSVTGTLDIDLNGGAFTTVVFPGGDILNYTNPSVAIQTSLASLNAFTAGWFTSNVIEQVETISGFSGFQVSAGSIRLRSQPTAVGATWPEGPFLEASTRVVLEGPNRASNEFPDPLIFSEFTSASLVINISEAIGAPGGNGISAGSGSIELSAALTSLTLQQPPSSGPGQVPLPAGLPLLLAGIGGLALMRRLT